jgi:hypothetical protein
MTAMTVEALLNAPSRPMAVAAAAPNVNARGRRVARTSRTAKVSTMSDPLSNRRPYKPVLW